MGTPRRATRRGRADARGSSDRNGSGWGRWVTLAAAGAGAYVAYRQLAKSKGQAIQVRESVTIARPVGEVYGFWRELENLPKVMDHLDSVAALGDGRSHWVAKGPAGSRVEWDAHTTLDRENEVIAWRSAEGATVPNHGSVRFRALDDGRTEVRVALSYHPPGGAVGAGFAKLFGEAPSQQVRDGLRRLKQELETGAAMRADPALPSSQKPTT